MPPAVFTARTLPNCQLGVSPPSEVLTPDTSTPGLQSIFSTLDNRPRNINTGKTHLAAEKKFVLWLKENVPGNENASSIDNITFTGDNCISFMFAIRKTKDEASEEPKLYSLATMRAIKSRVKNAYERKIGTVPSSVSKRFKDIMDLHTKELKDLKESSDANRYGPITEYYTRDEWIRFGQASMDKLKELTTDGAQRMNDRTFIHIASHFDFFFAYFTMMRSNNRKLAKLRDLGITELLNVPPTMKEKLKVVVFMKTQEKCIKENEIKYSRVIRTSNLNVCPVFALALSLYARFDIKKEAFPDLNDRKSWQAVPLMVNKSLEPLDEIILSKRVEVFLNDVAPDRLFTKKTHLGRKSGSTHAFELGVPYIEVAKQGGWVTTDALSTYYAFAQPVTYLYRIAGHEYNHDIHQGTIKLERALLNFDSDEFQSVEKQIFPWLETLFEPVIKAQSALPPRSRDIALEDVYKSMIYIRKCFVEDMVDYAISNSGNMMFQTGVFIGKPFKFLVDAVRRCRFEDGFVDRTYLPDSIQAKQLNVIDPLIIGVLKRRVTGEAIGATGATQSYSQQIAYALHNVATASISKGDSIIKLLKSQQGLRLDQLGAVKEANKRDIVFLRKQLTDVNAKVTKVTKFHANILTSHKNLKRRFDAIDEGLHSIAINQKRMTTSAPSALISTIPSENVIKFNNENYNGPWYSLCAFRNFIEIYNEHKNIIEPMDTITAGAWRKFSKINEADLKRRHSCYLLINLLLKHSSGYSLPFINDGLLEYVRINCNLQLDVFLGTLKGRMDQGNLKFKELRSLLIAKHHSDLMNSLN